MKPWWKIIASLPMVLALTACDDDAVGQDAAVAPPRVRDAATLARGHELFEQNCARCHGADAQGAFNWRVRQADGSFPPPPLNGTGHAWHHPRVMLHYVIRNGSPGGGNMPAWGGRLGDAEIDAIISWFQSTWPDEVYAAWWQIDQRSRQARN